MVSQIIGRHKIVRYDSIDELPMPRYHKFNKFVMIGAGIGENIEDADRHYLHLQEMNERGDKISMSKEIVNLRQSMVYAINDISPTSLAFAITIKSIDGVDCNDTSEYGLQCTLSKLYDQGIVWGLIKRAVELLKKKWRPRLKSISRTSAQSQ